MVEADLVVIFEKTGRGSLLIIMQIPNS